MNTSSVNGAVTGRPIEGPPGSSSTGSGSVEATALMPEPSQCDVSLAIAQMVIQNAFNSQTAARQDRQQATQRMMDAQKTQVAELRKEADQKLAAGCVEAAGRILSGAGSIANGLMTAGGKKDKGAAIKGGGDLLAGYCAVASAIVSHEADLTSARAKTAEMEAARQKDDIDAANDELDEARQHIRTALDFLRQFRTTEAESMRAAIRA